MIVGAREGDTGRAAVPFSRSAPVAGRGVLDEAESTMGYMWECPDFFTLNGKRVLMFSPQGCRPRVQQPQSVPERLSDRRVAAGPAFYSPWRIPGDG